MVNNKLKTIFGMFLTTNRYNTDLTCLKGLILPLTQERVDESEIKTPWFGRVSGRDFDSGI